MKKDFLVLLIFPLFLVAPSSAAYTLAANGGPQIIASSVAQSVEVFIVENAEDFGKEAYIDRMRLVVLDKERVWIVSIAEPRAGFHFVEVKSDGEISILAGEKLKTIRDKL